LRKTAAAPPPIQHMQGPVPAIRRMYEPLSSAAAPASCVPSARRTPASSCNTVAHWPTHRRVSKTTWPLGNSGASCGASPRQAMIIFTPTPARYSHRDAPADHSARTAFVPSIKNLDSPNCQFACFGKGYQAAARIPWISPNERAPSPGRGPRAGGQCADRLGAGGHGYRPTHAPTCFYSHGSRDITPLRATPC
jgi:hypothetical protein